MIQARYDETVGSCHLSWHVLPLSVARIVNNSDNLQWLSQSWRRPGVLRRAPELGSPHFLGGGRYHDRNVHGTQRLGQAHDVVLELEHVDVTNRSAVRATY